MGDGVGVDAGGDVVLVEHDVVGERLVVHELDGLTLGDGDLVGLRAKAEEGERGEFLFSVFCVRETNATREVDSREMTRVVRKLTCHSAVEARCASWQRRWRCRGERARTNARAAEARAAGGVTYEEAELAVVAAELDGGGERGGRHEDGGGTDDGGLRGSEQ